MNHSLLGTRRVILSIITRNFFVIRNKQPITIGTNRMCISRDDNCVNKMCFPRKLPTTARNLLSWLSSTGVIRVVLSIILLCGEFLKTYFLSMPQLSKYVCFKVEGASKLKVNAIFCDRLRWGYKLTFMSGISSHLGKEKSLRLLNELHLGKEKPVMWNFEPLLGITKPAEGLNKPC